MSEKIVQLNEEIIKGKNKELVRSSVEETRNELLEKETGVEEQTDKMYEIVEDDTELLAVSKVF